MIQSNCFKYGFMISILLLIFKDKTPDVSPKSNIGVTINHENHHENQDLSSQNINVSEQSFRRWFYTLQPDVNSGLTAVMCLVFKCFAH